MIIKKQNRNFIMIYHQTGSRYIPILFVYPYIIFSAVTQIITINRIQNKRFCLQNIRVYSEYLLFIYKDTHTQIIFWKYLHAFKCIYLN